VSLSSTSYKAALAAILVACKASHASLAGAPAWIQGDMVEIPGGTFEMGSDAPAAHGSERPVHRVTLKTFRLDRTEVTVGAYAECVRAGACREPEPYVDQRGNYRIFCNWKNPDNRLLHPINCVDFEMATSFCRWAHKRLPTEEEWEYGAREGRGGVYPWGDDMPDETRLNACGAGCRDNLVTKGFPAPPPLYEANDDWPETAPVGSFPAGASAHGILDMAGNVWEWTASEYAPYDGGPTEKKRVLRGGSWGGGDPRTERATGRFRLAPETSAQFLGFRCAQ
jgi:formylglycine-generating enzyme required for sulfatase activity